MKHEHRMALAKELVVALEQDNEDLVDSLLDEIAGLREAHLFQEIGRLTRQLHNTISSFSVDSKIMALTKTEIPDAKERLNYVITMTEQAAHLTLTEIENLLPVSAKLNEQTLALDAKWSRFLDKEMPYDEFKEMSREISNHYRDSKETLKRIQSGLNEILMAQGFQDITGQIIRRVIELVQDLESSMVEVIRISGKKMSTQHVLTGPDLPGPVVPGVDDTDNNVANNQDDVDDLLSSLGF